MTISFPISSAASSGPRKAWKLLVNVLLSTRVAAAAAPPAAENSTNPLTFDWYSLEPSDKLEWTACGGTLKCARLNLPLDYLSPDDGRKTAIALRLLPAKDRENFKGTILVNPGGPGNSGTLFMAQLGANMSRIIGESYDILGFDPRGVGASTPRADCYDNDVQRYQWGFGTDERLLNISDGSLPIVVARENLTALRCEAAIGGPDGIGKFMSTASVARDMLKINRLVGQEKLQYYGLSYGTVLGQYFAAMYPDKIERMVIDGVFDSHNYRAGLWNTNLADVDSMIAAFFQLCHDAGPDKCAIYSSSPQDIQARFFAALTKVEQQPIPLISVGKGGPSVVTAADLRSMLFQALYTPLPSFPLVASVVAAIETDDSAALAQLAAALSNAGRAFSDFSPMLMVQLYLTKSLG